jgi:hypothetical protein
MLVANERRSSRMVATAVRTGRAEAKLTLFTDRVLEGTTGMVPLRLDASSA